jgi:sodium/pantothenate symporter
MSTVDSQLILASAAIVKDLYLNYVNPGAVGTPEGERRIHRLSWIATAVLGIASLLVALRPPSIIVWINLFALGGLEAAFLFPLLLGLYWKRANAPGALASMFAGTLGFILMQQYWKRFLGMHCIVPTLILAGAVCLVVSLTTSPPPERVLRLFWGAPERNRPDRAS